MNHPRRFNVNAVGAVTKAKSAFLGRTRDLIDDGFTKIKRDFRAKCALVLLAHIQLINGCRGLWKFVSELSNA
jgi:hypothetical protein